jgi:hypothetical protein
MYYTACVSFTVVVLNLTLISNSMERVSTAVTQLTYTCIWDVPSWNIGWVTGCTAHVFRGFAQSVQQMSDFYL